MDASGVALLASRRESPLALFCVAVRRSLRRGSARGAEHVSPGGAPGCRAGACRRGRRQCWEISEQVERLPLHVGEVCCHEGRETGASLSPAQDLLKDPTKRLTADGKQPGRSAATGTSDGARGCPPLGVVARHKAAAKISPGVPLILTGAVELHCFDSWG